MMSSVKLCRPQTTCNPSEIAPGSSNIAYNPLACSSIQGESPAGLLVLYRAVLLLLTLVAYPKLVTT